MVATPPSIATGFTAPRADSAPTVVSPGASPKDGTSVLRTQVNDGFDALVTAALPSGQPSSALIVVNPTSSPNISPATTANLTTQVVQALQEGPTLAVGTTPAPASNTSDTNGQTGPTLPQAPEIAAQVETPVIQSATVLQTPKSLAGVDVGGELEGALKGQPQKTGAAPAAAPTPAPDGNPLIKANAAEAKALTSTETVAIAPSVSTPHPATKNEEPAAKAENTPSVTSEQIEQAVDQPTPSRSSRSAPAGRIHGKERPADAKSAPEPETVEPNSEVPAILPLAISSVPTPQVPKKAEVSAKTSSSEPAHQSVGLVTVAVASPPKQAEVSSPSSTQPLSTAQHDFGALIHHSSQANAQSFPSQPAPDTAPPSPAPQNIVPIPVLDTKTVQPSGVVPTIKLNAHSAEALANNVGLSIAKAARNGTTDYVVRLDPVELGKIEIRLNVGNDGQVQAVLASDNARTHDLLQREAPSITQSLNDAGLKTDSNSLSFDLRSGGGGSGQNSGANTQHFTGGRDTPTRWGANTLLDGELQDTTAFVSIQPRRFFQNTQIDVIA